MVFLPTATFFLSFLAALAFSLPKPPESIGCELKGPLLGLGSPLSARYCTLPAFDTCLPVLQLPSLPILYGTPVLSILHTSPSSQVDLAITFGTGVPVQCPRERAAAPSNE